MMKKTHSMAKRQRSVRGAHGSPMSDSVESIDGMNTVRSRSAVTLTKIANLTKDLRKKRLRSRLRELHEPEPIFSSEPLISYKLDPRLARNEKVVVTVKTTLQVHKNDRQEEQMKRPSPDVFGREAARCYVHGFVAAFSLSHDRLNWSLAEAEWAFSALEPYAVDVCGNKMALSGGNYVWLIDVNTGATISCQHPWLSQAHTAQFSADGTRLLVASAGFDAIFEFDSASGELVWEWFAWEHGFEQSQLGHYVVRSAERSEALKTQEQEVFFVDDPAKFEFGVPTRLCPAHLNSAIYDRDGNILVTLFHQGAGIIIDKATGKTRNVVSGLINPHKLSKRKSGGYFVSDTRRGKLIFIDEKSRRVKEIALTNMPGLERSDQLSEFLQNTTELKDDLFACIDIHRNCLWLVDVKRRRYRGVKFPAEWSMHDVVPLGREYRRIGSLVGTAFGKVKAYTVQEKVIRHLSPDGREIATFTLDTEGRHRELGFQM
jgi:hypothetical protein